VCEFVIERQSQFEVRGEEMSERVSEEALRELWKVVSGGLDDEAGTRRWAKQLRPGQINQEDPSQVSE
jgi:hypothetical protein